MFVRRFHRQIRPSVITRLSSTSKIPSFHIENIKEERRTGWLIGASHLDSDSRLSPMSSLGIVSVVGDD